MSGFDRQLALLLAAREERWAKRQAYSERFPALLSATACIPIPLRTDPAVEAWFSRASDRALAFLKREGLTPTVLERDAGPDGPWLMAGFPQSPLALKERCVYAEETFPDGRLLDLDVTAAGGDAVSRRGLGLLPRRCLLCGRPAAECASRGLHPREEVLARVRELLEV